MEELKTHKILFVLILFFSSKTIFSQDSALYTLEQCISMALKNSVTYNNSFFQKERSTLQKHQAVGSLLPSVSAFGNQGISNGKSINPFTNTFINQQVNTGNYGLNASLNIFNGFSNLNSLFQNNLSNLADKCDLEQATIDLKIQVTQAYLAILNAKELLKQANSQKELTQAQVMRLQTLNEHQAISPAILYDTKGQLANDKVFISNSLVIYKTAILTLGQIINYDFSDNSKFESLGINTEPKMISLVSTSISAPMLKSSEYRNKSAYKSLQASRGSVFPTVSLVGSLGSNYSSVATIDKYVNTTNEATSAYVLVGGNPSTVYQPRLNFTSEKIQFNDQLKNNLNSYVGVSIQLPLLNGLRGKTQMQTAKLNYRQTELQLKASKNRFSQIIKQTTVEAINALETYNIYTEQLEDYKNSLAIATTKFENGALNTFEFLIAKNNYDRSKVNLINSKFNYVLKEMILNIYSNYSK